MNTTKEKILDRLAKAEASNAKTDSLLQEAKDLVIEDGALESSVKSFATRIFSAFGITIGEPTAEKAEEVVAKVTEDKKEVADKTAEAVGEEVKKTIAKKAEEVKNETPEDAGKVAVKKTEEKIVSDIDTAKETAKTKVKDEVNAA